MILPQTGACEAQDSGQRTSLLARLVAPLNDNFGRPHGLLGRLAGWIMARENVRANRLVVELLEIRAEDRVLEIGCGPGVALAEAASRANRGFVTGADPSSVMVGQARRRCRKAIAAGRAEVRQAPAAALPYPAASFTRAFSVNALPHWPSAREGLAEVRRVLMPEARTVVALRKQRQGSGVDPHAHGATAEQVASLCALLEELGFRDVEASDHELGRETLVTISATAS
jgi:ubiquinone/menaquinone biosynthesis C-methylase UbiE